MIRKKPEREDPFTIIDYHTPDIVSSVIFQFVRKFFSPWSAKEKPAGDRRRKERRFICMNKNLLISIVIIAVFGRRCQLSLNKNPLVRQGEVKTFQRKKISDKKL